MNFQITPLLFKGSSQSQVWTKRLTPVVAVFLLAVAWGANARDLGSDSAFLTKAATPDCPEGWVSSNAPGGCSPEFFTLKLAGIHATDGCPDGWVSSSAPGGCSPGFFTLRMNGVRDSRRCCPDGWVRSSVPGGCSPDYITLARAGLHATKRCPDGWVPSSAPGGCSPDNFTLEPDSSGVDRARYHCAFGDACDHMIEAVFALGGTCTSEGPDTTCDLPPLIED